MSNYTKSTNFTAKDTLASGNPSKVILGSEHDAEYNAIATSIATKVDDINSLSSETTIETGDLEVFYDVSAGVHKKITRQNKQRPILQIVYASQAGSSTSSTSYANLSNSVVTITPVSASSKILLEVSFNARISNVAATNTTGTFSFYETTAGTALGNEYVLEAFSASGGTGVGVPGIIRHRINSTGTTSRSFGLQGKTNTGSATASASFAVWTITEYIE